MPQWQPMCRFLTTLLLSLSLIASTDYSLLTVGADGQTLTSVFDVTVSLALSSPSEAGTICGADTTSGLIARLNSLFDIDESIVSSSLSSQLFQVGSGAVNADPSSNSSCVARIYLGSSFSGASSVVSKAAMMSGCCLSSTLRTMSETLQSATSSDAQMQLMNGILPLLHISSLTEVAAGSSGFPTSPASCSATDVSTYCSTSSSSTTSTFTPTAAPTVSGDVPKTTFDAAKFFGSRSCIDFFSDPDVATSLPSNLGVDSSLVVRKGSTQLNTTTPLHLCAAGDTLSYTSMSEFTFMEPTPAPATVSEGSAPSIFNMASAMSMFLHSWSTTASSSSSASSISEDAADPANIMCSKHYGAFGQYGLLRVGDLKRSGTTNNGSMPSFTTSQGLTCAALLNTTRLLEFSHSSQGSNIISASPFTYTINFRAGTSISSLLSGFQRSLDAALVDARSSVSTSDKNTSYLEAIIVRPLWVEPPVSGGRATAIVVGFDYTYTSADEALLPWDRRESELPLFNRNVFYNCIWQQGMSKVAPPTPPGPPGRAVRDFPLMWIGTGITGAMTIFMIFVVRRRPKERQDPLGNQYDKSLLTEAMTAAEGNYRLTAQHQQSASGPSKTRRRADSGEAAAAAGLDRAGKARDAEMASVQMDVGDDHEAGGVTTEGTRYFKEEFAKDLPEGMLGGGALVLHSKFVPSYQQAMIDRKYEGPRPVTSVGKSGGGKRVDQAAFDGDDNSNPVAAVGGSPTLPNKDERDSPHLHTNSDGKSRRRVGNPQHEGKALFADSTTSSVVHTGNGVDVVVPRDAFAGGGTRVKTAKKSGASAMGEGGTEDPFGW